MRRDPLVVALLLFAAAPVAEAQPAARQKLLLLATPGGDLDPRALADAIRVQVLDLGMEVEVAEEAPAPTLAGRLRAAIERGDEAGAPMVVLYDRAPAETEVVLYVTRRRGPRALVTVIRLPAEPSGSLYRTFALKVRDLVRDMVRIEPAREPTRASPPALPPPAPAEPRWAFPAGWAVLAPPALGAVQHGPTVGVMRSLGGGLEGHLDTGLFLSTGFAVGDGHAELTTVPARAGARFMRRFGRFAVGGGPVVGASLHVATGRDSRGHDGGVLRAVPVVGAEIVGRIRVHSALALEAAGFLDLMLVRQRFSLSGEPAFELGRIAFGGRIRLVISVPGGSV